MAMNSAAIYIYIRTQARPIGTGVMLPWQH